MRRFESLKHFTRDATAVGQLVAVLLGPVADRPGLLAAGRRSSSLGRRAPLCPAADPTGGIDEVTELVPKFGGVVSSQIDLVDNAIESEGDSRDVIKQGLQKLSNRWGVRRHNLRTVLTPELQARWGIEKHHSLQEVRRIVVAKLSELVKELANNDLRVVARVTYGLDNLVPDTHLNTLERRYKWLGQSESKEKTGINASKCPYTACATGDKCVAPNDAIVKCDDLRRNPGKTDW